MPTTSSSTNFQDVINSSGSTAFVKLEEEQLSICIYINGTLECFKNNNFAEESVHLQNVFGADRCEVWNEGSVQCVDEAAFACNVYSNGEVFCTAEFTGGGACYVYDDSTVDCY